MADGVPPQAHRRVFYGEAKADPDSAVESACEVALRHLSEQYNLVFDDFHYSAYVEKRESLRVAEERNREMGAELEAMQKGVIHKTKQLDKLVQDVEGVCLEFAHILPVRAGGSTGVEYVGPPSPAGGHDKLALDLVQLLHSVIC